MGRAPASFTKADRLVRTRKGIRLHHRQSVDASLILSKNALNLFDSGRRILDQFWVQSVGRGREEAGAMLEYACFE